MCELGANCPYRHEHQHTSEFAHPGDDDAAPVAPPRPFEGAGRGAKLGGLRVGGPHAEGWTGGASTDMRMQTNGAPRGWSAPVVGEASVNADESCSIM